MLLTLVWGLSPELWLQTSIRPRRACLGGPVVLFWIASTSLPGCWWKGSLTWVLEVPELLSA